MIDSCSFHSGYYRSITDVSTATVTNDLGRALAAGYLAPNGSRGGRWYSAGPHLVTRLAGVLRLDAGPGIAGRPELVHALASRLSRLGSQTDAIRRFLEDCRDLAPDRVAAANEHWTARFRSREHDLLLSLRQRVRAAIAETPAVRAAWSRAQRELFAVQASSDGWRAPLELQSPLAPETFAEAALMALAARELLSRADYCRMVRSAARAIPWLAAGCPTDSHPGSE